MSFLTLLYPRAMQWTGLASGFGAADYGILSWILTAFAVGVALSGVRDLVASRRLHG